MSEYRRYFVPGGSYFFTIVTYQRRPIFADSTNVEYLRAAIRDAKQEMPFEINAAVILPDHMHFIWTLPGGDSNYSKRIGLMKVSLTQAIKVNQNASLNVSASRIKHRESDVWQRRFWEHTIQDEEEFENHFHYIHYNPVKHGYVSCPHLWKASSFHWWVANDVYEPYWGCSCEGRKPKPFDFSKIEHTVGE